MTTTEIVKKDVGTVAEFKVNRVENGIKVFMKSEWIESLFKTSAGARESSATTNPGWEGRKFYPLVTGSGISVRHEYVRIDKAGHSYMYHPEEQYYNASIVRAVGLKNGVDVVFTGPNSVEEVRKWVEHMKTYVKHLYINYLRPVDIDITITVKEAVE